MHAPPWFKTAEPLAPRTTLEVGGRARWLAECADEARFVEALAWAEDHQVPVQILGGGSNTLVADAGFDGLVVVPRMRGVEQERRGAQVEITAAAGERWDDLVAQTVTQGLSGLACLSGIPGRVGAAPIQNIGAYGQEVAQRLLWVRVWDRVKVRARVLSAAECGFGYRSSRFKSDLRRRFVVLSATFGLQVAPPVVGHKQLAARLNNAPTVGQVREAVLELRRSKSMVYDLADPNHRSAGSFFMNPVISAQDWGRVQGQHPKRQIPNWPTPNGQIKLSAAWLIEHSGLPKGSGNGRVGLSSRHTLALINRGGATALELLKFAAFVRARVLARFGVQLTPEPVLVGFEQPATALLDGLGASALAL